MRRLMLKKIKWLAMAVSVILILSFVLTGCSTNTTTSTSNTSITSTATGTSITAVPATLNITLNGAGATFPAPLYTKWFDVYNKAAGVKVNYQAIGSGAGITQITAGTVDFGASDGIMTADQQTKAEAAGGPILHIPMTDGAVAVIYNIAGVSGHIKLSGKVLANIYLKNITKWNDPAITALNSGVDMPDEPIAVVHRSDGSGTTNIFTNYLAKVSEEWNTRVGTANSVNWPGDLGGEKNAGVAAQVKQTPNSIGYVELAYATQNNITYALLQNSSGNFVEPTLASTSAAAAGVTLPDDMKIMLTNSSNPDAYPIVGFTWLLVFVNQTDKDKGTALVNVLWWAIHDGQQYTNPLFYGALSADAVKKAEAEIKTINYQGQTLLNP